jgi:small subunit ribosomal protein S17e
MGRIKTVLTKRVSEELFAKHGENFTENFEENKARVGKYAEIPSHKLRNIIAGYLTRLVRTKEKY